MASDLVNLATKETLDEPDWARNIQICEIASNSHEQAKDVIKAIKKRLGSKNPNVQLFAVALLEMLMNNCGEHIHKMVMETGLLRSMVKIVKKKSDLPVREKIFLLLDATQTALGGAKGKFPQYYAAYYDLVCAHVEFPQRSTSTSAEPTSRGLESNPSDSGAQKHDVAPQPQKSSSEADSSIIQKASSVMEVLQEVLNALDRKHPKGAGDEFTLDLVEQCSFQKQRVMHLAMTARDEKLVSEALKLNDQLDKLLKKHDELLSLSNDPVACGSCEDVENDDEANHLSRRRRKGKASTSSWGGDEEASSSSSSESLSYAKPLPRNNGHTAKNAPLRIEPRDSAPVSEAIAIPPPPAKHKEREIFFKEKEVRGSGNANGTNSA